MKNFETLNCKMNRIKNLEKQLIVNDYEGDEENDAINLNSSKQIAMNKTLNEIVKIPTLSSLSKIENIFDINPLFQCFGCSTHSKTGLKLNYFRDEQTEQVFSFFELDKEFTSFVDILHGGVLGIIVDDIAFWTVFSKHQRLALTSSLSLEFKRISKPHQKMFARGTIKQSIENNNNNNNKKIEVIVDIFSIQSIIDKESKEKKEIAELCVRGLVVYTQANRKQIDFIFGKEHIKLLEKYLKFD